MFHGINRKPNRRLSRTRAAGTAQAAPDPTRMQVQTNHCTGRDLDTPELRQRKIEGGKECQSDDTGVRDDDDRLKTVTSAPRSHGAEERRKSLLRLGQRLPVGESEAIGVALPYPELVRPAVAHLTLRQSFPASEANFVQSPIDGTIPDAEGSRDDLRGPDRPAQGTRHDGRDALAPQAAGRTVRLAHPCRRQRDVAAALIPALRRPARFAVPDEIDRRTPRRTGPDPSFRGARHDNTIPAIGAAPSSPSSARHSRP